MSMVLKNNTAAMWAMNELNRNDKNLSKSLKKSGRTNGKKQAFSMQKTEAIRKSFMLLLNSLIPAVQACTLDTSRLIQVLK